MKGLMQHQPLVVTNFLDYAARWHGEQASADARSCTPPPQLRLNSPIT